MTQKMPLYPASTLAKLFNLSERRIRQLAQAQIIPKKQNGKYDLVGSVQGYLRYLQDQAAGHGMTTEAIHAARLRRIKAQADEKELVLLQRAGSQMDAQLAIELGGRSVTATKIGFLAMADRLMQMLSLSQAQRSEIEHTLRQALIEQSDYTDTDIATAMEDDLEKKA